MRVLIAGVGYRFMRDLSVGPVLIPRLERLTWPPGVETLDLHFGPVHFVHWLEQAGPYDRIIFIASTVRGRAPGVVTCYHWAGLLPDPDEIQARIAEAVTGVISLDNLLIVGQQFGALPDDVVVIEVEAIDTAWGEGFTPEVEAALDAVVDLVRHEAVEAAHV